MSECAEALTPQSKVHVQRDSDWGGGRPATFANGTTWVCLFLTSVSQSKFFHESKAKLCLKKKWKKNPKWIIWLEASLVKLTLSSKEQVVHLEDKQIATQDSRFKQLYLFPKDNSVYSLKSPV